MAYAAGPLKAFANCDAVLGYFKEHAPDYLIEQAGRGWAGGSADGGVERSSRPVAARAADDTAGGAAPTPGSFDHQCRRGRR